ncbi:MAG: hypothetical protein ACYTG7_18180, partial [Planctomycetota bacterium]
MKIMRIVLAVVITLLMVVTARYFGPNRKYTVETRADGLVLSHKAPRSQTGEGPAALDVRVKLDGRKAADLDIELKGRVKGAPDWERLSVARIESGDEGWDKVFVFEVPPKPYTTRYFYTFEIGLAKEEQELSLAREDGAPMMVKFKGDVPAWIVIAHVLGMFGGFFLLILCAFHSVGLAMGREDHKASSRLAWWSWIVMFMGGVPFGFAMNYYAFNVFWEAFPFGGDVTDNKTQIALLLWGLAAVGLSWKKGR